MTDRLLTKKELATSLRVSLRAIERWQSQGMPMEKLGTACRYDLAAILAWHRQQSHHQPKQTPHDERNPQV
jgi:phage terminase Nu1 subunit (DNA packaging protein)